MIITAHLDQAFSLSLSPDEAARTVVTAGPATSGQIAMPVKRVRRTPDSTAKLFSPRSP